MCTGATCYDVHPARRRLQCRPVTPPRAILFDLDDTILSAYSRSDAAWLSVAHELADAIAPLTPADAATAILEYAREFWADPERHRVWRQKLSESRRHIVRGTLARLARDGRPGFAAEVAVRLADRYTAYRDECMHVFPGALETLNTLRAVGIRLALVTNGAGADQWAKIERFALRPYFHHIQVEGDHGFGKPDAQAYLHAMAALEVDASETWMVGDNLEWEVAAPQRLGIYSIWHDTLGNGLPAGSSVRPDRIIGRLSELARDFEAGGLENAVGTDRAPTER
jgi:putative hydrolase of the HAD superfamily